MDDLAIETSGLTKSFGKQTAVNALDLAVPAGSVFGFLGPNGSGKTTTIRMLLGLASASSGDIRMLGDAMPDAAGTVLPRVGALVEGPAFYPFLSGRANLRRLDSAGRHAASVTRSVRVDAALHRVGLSHAASKKAHAYSLGMKQRLGIANALLTPRDLLILDEPSNGLDPQGTREVRSLIRSLAEGGTTIFVSSHLLAEIEQMCTHVAVMSAGRLVAQGPLDELRAQGTARVRVRTPDPGDARRVLAGLGLGSDVADDHDSASTSADRADRTDPATQPDEADRATPSTRADRSEAAHSADSTTPADRALSDRSSLDRSAPDRDAVVTAELTAPGLLPEQITAALVAADVRVRGFVVEGSSLEERFVALTGEGFDVAE